MVDVPLGPSNSLAYLRIISAVSAMDAQRVDVIRSAVFSPILVPHGERAEYAKYTRLLEGSLAHNILTIIWKESDFMAGHPNSTGMKKTSLNGITQHGLAVAMAETPGEVGALNSFIRNVSIAAEKFGLLERNIAPNKVYLVGTSVLHRMMTLVAEGNRLLMRDVLQGDNY